MRLLIPYTEKVCGEYWDHTGFRSRLLISFETSIIVLHEAVKKVTGFWFENRSETGVCNVSHPLEHCHWRGTTTYNRRHAKRYQMDTLLHSRGPWFCRLPCSLVTLSDDLALLSHSQMTLLSCHTLIVTSNKRKQDSISCHTLNVTYKKRQQDSTLSVNKLDYKLAKSKPKWWLQASQVHQLWRSGSLNWQALPPSHTWVASLGRMEVQAWTFRADWLRPEVFFISMKAVWKSA